MNMIIPQRSLHGYHVSPSCFCVSTNQTLKRKQKTFRVFTPSFPCGIIIIAGAAVAPPCLFSASGNHVGNYC